MDRMVGELIGKEIDWCSTHFVEKLIIHHLRKGLVKAYWICDSSEVESSDFYFNIGQAPLPKEFCYSTVKVRLP